MSEEYYTQSLRVQTPLKTFPQAAQALVHVNAHVQKVWPLKIEWKSSRNGRLSFYEVSILDMITNFSYSFFSEETADLVIETIQKNRRKEVENRVRRKQYDDAH